MDFAIRIDKSLYEIFAKLNKILDRKDLIKFVANESKITLGLFFMLAPVINRKC